MLKNVKKSHDVSIPKCQEKKNDFVNSKKFLENFEFNTFFWSIFSVRANEWPKKRMANFYGEWPLGHSSLPGFHFWRMAMAIHLE